MKGAIHGLYISCLKKPPETAWLCGSLRFLTGGGAMAIMGPYVIKEAEYEEILF